jgi:flagellar basal body-associated protein FliL
MPSKKPSSGRIHILIGAVIAVFIVAKWISVFFNGHVPAGYP